MRKQIHHSKPDTAHNRITPHLVSAEPFETAEELWFWFIAAQAARNDGARYASGLGSINRPCEPVDILKILDGLYRKRLLLRDHLLVLRYYGRRYLAPDPNRVKEKRAFFIWVEAFERLEPVLEKKGLIEQQSWTKKFHPQNYAETTESGKDLWR